jgi:hypothetical protein
MLIVEESLFFFAPLADSVSRGGVYVKKTCTVANGRGPLVISYPVHSLPVETKQKVPAPVFHCCLYNPASTQSACVQDFDKSGKHSILDGRSIASTHIESDWPGGEGWRTA